MHHATLTRMFRDGACDTLNFRERDARRDRGRAVAGRDAKRARWDGTTDEDGRTRAGRDRPTDRLTDDDAFRTREDPDGDYLDIDDVRVTWEEFVDALRDATGASADDAGVAGEREVVRRARTTGDATKSIVLELGEGFGGSHRRRRARPGRARTTRPKVRRAGFREFHPLGCFWASAARAANRRFEAATRFTRAWPCARKI